MSSPIYREQCPNYPSGAGHCCGATHDTLLGSCIDQAVKIELTDGSHVTISRFDIGTTVHNSILPAWTTQKHQSAGVVDAELRWDELTSESQEIIGDIHSGIIITKMLQDCPLRDML
jgi:hypothetical protein